MFTLNEGQEKVVTDAVHFYRNESRQVFEISGGAGTGKTTIIRVIADRLGIPMSRVLVVTYTGAAAILLRFKGFYNATTIHSALYTPVESYKYDNNGNIVMNTYLNRPQMILTFEPKQLIDIDLIFVDEAGMVPKDLGSELISRGIKIITTGDLNQLPPITGKPFFLSDESRINKLTQIMRQKEGSAVLYLADRAIKGLPIHKGFYGNVLVIDEDEITDKMVLMSDIILCGKNNTRDIVNRKVRQDLLRISSDLPVQGEKVICRRNNWNIEVDGISLVNGLAGNVLNAPDISGFSKDLSYRMDFKPNMMDSYFKDLVCDYKYLISPYEIKKDLKNDKYQGVGMEKFEFAYSITTHLSQGNQYNSVMYLEEYLHKDIQRNLNYTAITRSSNFLIYVKKKKKFY